jgi:hypothetical protein
VTARPRLLAWPIGNREVASSRLRLYAPLAELADRFDAYVVEPGGAERADPVDLLARADLLFVQKDARPEAVALAHAAAHRGVPVVYDLDDDPGCWPGMDEPALLRLATRVIVDSALRAAAVAPWTSTVHPVPCVIDLADDPARLLDGPAPPASTVVTFGNRSSLEGTRPFLAALPPATTVRVIGPVAARAEFPDVDFQTFALDTFVADVCSGGFAVLAHDPAEAPRKDENRLVMALSCRRAAFVAPNPAYRAVLAGFDGDELLVETPADLARALDTIGPARLAELADAGCAHVWRTHAPAVISARVAEVLTDALDSR